MERLTYDFCIGGIHCWEVHGADNNICADVCKEQGDKGCEECPIRKAIDRLAAYEDAMPLERAQELAQAEKDGRLVVLNRTMEPLVWGDDANETILCPNCENDLMGGFKEDEYFENDMYQCPYCGQPINSTNVMTREDAEAALKKREADEEAGK